MSLAFQRSSFPRTRSRNSGADSNGQSTGRGNPSAIPVAMTLRRPFRARRPDLDKFLFAPVGEEINGVPLSVVSALVRLGLDPWEEAGRLSTLSGHEAIEQLARLISETPGRSCPLAEAREVAGRLVVLLPNHDTTAPRFSGSAFAVPLAGPIVVTRCHRKAVKPSGLEPRLSVPQPAPAGV